MRYALDAKEVEEKGEAKQKKNTEWKIFYFALLFRVSFQFVAFLYFALLSALYLWLLFEYIASDKE